MSEDNNSIFDENKRNQIIKYIEYNNLSGLQGYLKANKIELKQLNSNDFDILISSIENNASFNILKFIYNQCQYETLNYCILSKEFGRKSPLLSALSKNNFDVANFLLQNGADIHYELYSFDIFYYLEGLNKLNNRNLKYILNNGYKIKHLESFIMRSLIENLKNDFIKIIFKTTIFDNNFILQLLNYFKNKTPKSKKELKKIVKTEKRKIEIQRDWYEKAMTCNNNEILQLLLNYDYRKDKKIFMELVDIIEDYDRKNHTDKRFTIYRKIKNKELRIKINSNLLNNLEIPDFKKHRKEIIKYIDNDEFEKMKSYIEENHVNIRDINSKNFDILIYCIENRSSNDIFAYFVKNFYDDFNYFINKEDGFQTPLIAAVSTNQYAFADVLFAKGADGNYNIKDIIPPGNDNKNSICLYLYEKKLLNEYNFHYLMVSRFVPPLFIPVSLLLKFIDNFDNELLSTVFENCKSLPVGDSWYKHAITKGNHKALEILFDNDPRPKNTIAQLILVIITIELNDYEKDEFFKNLKSNKIIEELKKLIENN